MNKKLMGMTGLLGCAAIVLMSGCSVPVNTNILPKGNDHYTVVSTSSSQSAAMNDAMKKAKETCKKQHKSFVVVKDDSKYSGANKNLKSAMNVASSVAFFNHSDAYVPGGSSLDSESDNKVSIEFKCVK